MASTGYLDAGDALSCWYPPFSSCPTSGTFHPVFLFFLWPNRQSSGVRSFSTDYSLPTLQRVTETGHQSLTLLHVHGLYFVPSNEIHSPPAAVRGGFNRPLSSSHTPPFSWGHMSESSKISLYSIPEATKEAGATEAMHFQ